MNNKTTVSSHPVYLEYGLRKTMTMKIILESLLKSEFGRELSSMDVALLSRLLLINVIIIDNRGDIIAITIKCNKTTLITETNRSNRITIGDEDNLYLYLLRTYNKPVIIKEYRDIYNNIRDIITCGECSLIKIDGCNISTSRYKGVISSSDRASIGVTRMDKDIFIINGNVIVVSSWNVHLRIDNEIINHSYIQVVHEMNKILYNVSTKKREVWMHSNNESCDNNMVLCERIFNFIINEYNESQDL